MQREKNGEGAVSETVFRTPLASSSSTAIEEELLNVEKNEKNEKRFVKKKRNKSNEKLSTPFCCISKDYFSDYPGLVESLQITPRCFICKTKLVKRCKYGQTFILKNNGRYPRFFKYSTDSPLEITIEVKHAENHRYILPDETLEVNVNVVPNNTKDINRRRNVYVESEHPNIIFEIPIIVVTQTSEPSIPETITFASCPPYNYNTTYYEFIAYNPTQNPVRVKAVSMLHHLRIKNLDKKTIQPNAYLRVFLTLQPKKLQVDVGSIAMKFGTQQPRVIQYSFTPKLVAVHINIGNVDFSTVKFERELKHTITICNEGSNELSVDSEFMNELNTLFHNKQSESTEKGAEEEENVVGVKSSHIKEAISMHSELLYDFRDSELKAESSVISYQPFGYKHFRIRMPDVLPPYSSEEGTITFHPIYDLDNPFDDEVDPPYLLRTKLFFCFADKHDCIQSCWINVTGQIIGPDIELYPKVVEFRKIYLGEEHCAQIRVINRDGILNAKVKFKDYLNKDLAGITVSPADGYLLEPCTRGNFHMAFFSKIPSKFNILLRFKVVNGAIYSVELKGQGLHVQLRTFPQMVEFGSIPIAIPQKRYLLLMNPLSVPVTLQVHPTDDGEEQPLVLNVKDNVELMPITVKDPILQLQQMNEDLRDSAYEHVDIELTNKEDELQSYQSYSTLNSTYSDEFEDEIMETLPTIATQMITALKRQKVFDKSETDKRVVQEAMNYLLSTKYFNIFLRHSNFVYMDWNAIPSDPKEIYCDNEIIYLRPNTGKSITILVIPNNVGYFHRSLTMRICPTNVPSMDNSENETNTTLINSEFLCSKLWFEYNCCIPEIEWFNYISLQHRIIYAGQDYEFDIAFRNTSSISGFFHFDVVPKEMSFLDGIWKYFIAADEDIIVRCSVTFGTIGSTKLSGIVKIVGSNRPYPYHIVANVLPTQITFSPKSIRRRIQVLEESRIHIYIDNRSPTNTNLLMRLADATDQFLTTRGGILAASGQSMYTTLVTKFYDPDVYTNTIYIDLQFNHVVEIPVTFHCDGVPIFFEPNIKEGFDAGIILTECKDHFYANIYNYNQIVKVSNLGRRAYRLSVTRLKTTIIPLNAAPGTKPSFCSTTLITARFDIFPKSLSLEPESHDYLSIVASGYEECICQTEFRIEIIDQKYAQPKVFTMRVVMTGTFMHSNLAWSRKVLHFEYNRTTCFQNRPFIELCELVNPHSVPVENIYLQATGPFRIKELFEHQFVKYIYIRMEPNSRKEIFVILNKAPLRDVYCTALEGRLDMCIYGRLMRPLKIKVKVLVPDVIIPIPELILFSPGREFNSIVEIANVGCMKADYKWKRLNEAQYFIGKVDISRDFIADLLSEIINMVDYQLGEEDSELNMTLRYQKYRCKYQEQTETRNDILDILYEIIDNLDLEHSRYVVHLDEPLSESVEHSSSFIRRTISELIGKLKLEASCSESSVSSDKCFPKHSIFFYEKAASLEPGEQRQCLLHLPYLRRSYEATATFQLDIVAGRSQTLNVTVVNLPQKIQFSRDNIYLNIRPWYELCQSKLRVYNITKYELRLRIEEYFETPPTDKRLVVGFAKLKSDMNVNLEPFESSQIKLDIILGFSESFKRVFRVDVNDCDEGFFYVRGQGVMPILCMSTLLSMIEQDPFEIADEYNLLQIIYQYEMFKSITEVDVEPEKQALEEDDMEDFEDISIDFSISDTDESMDSARIRAHDLLFFKIVQTYVLVNNNEELPNAIVLKQLLETLKYMRKLRANIELYKLHQQVYNKFLKSQKSLDEKLPLNLKHFVVEPIPCELHGHVLDLGELKLNTLRRFSFKLHFFGPGKLIAAARTAVKIPGLYVDFKVEKHEDKKFTYWAQKCTAPEFFDDKYRNMFERLMDADMDPKVKHAHSFDLDELIKHQRDLTKTDRQLIDLYYNSLNLSVYADHKHHFTLCKVFTRAHSNFSGVDMHVMGIIKPESKYYTHDQLLEDIIFIDLHMGPTLPILVRAIMKQ